MTILHTEAISKILSLTLYVCQAKNISYKTVQKKGV